MQIAPLPNNENDRLAALNSCGILDTPPESIYDAITQLAADICDVPIALVSLIDTHRQWFKSAQGMGDTRETSRDAAFCAHSILSPQLMEVPDATLDQRFHDNPLVQSDPKIRFYAGMPLVTSDGYSLGTLCVIDRQPRRLSPPQRKSLEQLSAVVISLIESRRRSHNTRLGEILENSFNEIYLFDAETLRYRHVNDGARRNLQYSTEELNAMSPLEIATDLDRARFAQLIAPLHTGAAELVTFETEHLRKDNTCYPVQVRMHLSQASEQSLYVAIATDISEQKRTQEALRESENRLRQIAEKVDQVFWLFGWGKGSLLYVNPAYERVWGRSANDLYNDPNDWLAGVHPDDRPILEKALAEHTATGNFSAEYRVVRTDGSERWIRDRRIPLFDDEGNVFRVAGIAEDVTERRQQEINNRELLDQLAHAARLNAMGEMASTLAHELNQPLTAIAHYCDAALSMTQSLPHPDAEIVTTLENVYEQAQRAGTIIRQLRQFVTKQTPQKSLVDLNELIEETLEFFSLELRDKGVDTVVRFARDLPALPLNKIQIQQVLLNLGRNGIDAMAHDNSDSRELTILTHPEREGAVRVTVRDTGPGLSANAESQLFKPFHTGKPHGMGMGLSISRSIIEAHGGKLWAEPASPQGAIFHFTLPVSTTESNHGNQTDSICGG